MVKVNPTDAPITHTTLEEWQRITQTNATGAFLCIKAVCKAMSAQDPITHQDPGNTGPTSPGCGAIVNVSSTMGFVGVGGRAAYTASKHAVSGLVKVAGEYLSRDSEFGRRGS
jgi:NAD(P)-dependent dehydrogenase (short-subunit alcohol dehydrogenase family)